MPEAPPEVHSLMGASSLERRKLCPGSYEQEKGKPDTTSEWAELGNLGHSLIAKVLLKKITREEALTEAGKKDIEVAVDAAIQYAWAKIDEHPTAQIIVEEPLQPDEIHKEIKKTTPDLTLVIPFKWSGVYDWKMGQGDVEKARNNIQLATLGVATADKYEVPEVEVGVVLAAQGWVSEHTMNSVEIENARSHIQMVINASLAPWAPLFSGKKQCQYCRAKLTCPRLLSEAEEGLKAIRTDDQLDGPGFSRILTAFEGFGQWYQAVKKEAFQYAFGGGDVPGFGIVEGRSTRQWKDSVTQDDLEAMAEELGKDPKKVTKQVMLSPAQMESKEGGWGKAKKVVEAMMGLVFKAPGEKKLEKIGGKNAKT